MFKLLRRQKDYRYFLGNRYEKYSIKKLKVGAASVLVGAGFLFGYNVDTVEADSATEIVAKNYSATEASNSATEIDFKNSSDTEVSDSATEIVVKNGSDTEVSDSTNVTSNTTVKIDSDMGIKSDQQPPQTETEFKLKQDDRLVDQEKTVKGSEKTEEQPSTVLETINLTERHEEKPSVALSALQVKLSDLEAQLERIRGNKNQVSRVQSAEKLVVEAKQYLDSLDSTQKDVDAKTKEISSLTSVLKSIKAEYKVEENKNQDGRNGKQMEEGTGFRTGVTEKALTGSINFDSSTGPIEKKIPVGNGGNGSRFQRVSVTYSSSSAETVVGGKVRITVPKEFLHSDSQPVFKHSTFVKKVEDKSTESAYVYELSLNDMTGGTVAESEMTLKIGTSIKNAPSNGDRLNITVELGTGDNYTVSKTATATFDYLSEILYRESDTRKKELGSFIFNNPNIPYTQAEAEWKLGSVIDGNFKPIENATYRLPFVFSNAAYFQNREADSDQNNSHNGNGRLIKYDYTISGIPDIFEIAPSTKNSGMWKLENGVATFIPKNEVANAGHTLTSYDLYLRLKEGVLATSEEIQKYIETTATKGHLPAITYTAVGHRPDGTTFTQELPSNNAFRIYASDKVPTVGSIYTYIWTPNNQKLYSNQSDTDMFRASVDLQDANMKGDGGIFSGDFVNYFIPEDQKDNYFTSFRLENLKYAKLNEDGSKSTIDYTDKSGKLVKPFKLYGINDQKQPELIKEYTNVEDMSTPIKFDSSKRYQHLVLEHTGIEDKYHKDGEKIKIKAFNAFLDVKVPSWKEKSEDDRITRYDNQISLSFSDNLAQASSAVRPNTGRDEVAIHNKTPYDLALEMNALNGRGVNSTDISRGKTLPVIVSYHASDYFNSLNETEDGVETRNLSKLDPNVTETRIMLLADSNLPLKDFRVTTDNRLLTTDAVFALHEGRALQDYDKIKANYSTVTPVKTITNYKNTGKTAYFFDTKDLGITKYDVSNNIKGLYGFKPVALTFEVENTGLVESNTYNIESYLVWNSNSQTLKGRDRSLNSDYVEGHENGNTIARASIDVKFTNVIEYYTALGISKPGTSVVREIIDVENGSEVTLTPTIQNLTDKPKQIKEAVVLVPKTEAVTYLEGPISNNSDSWEVVYTTSTVEDKTTATYVTADHVSNWKDVTAVKYIFKSDYQVTKAKPFVDHFNVRVDKQNPNFIQSTSQIFLKNDQDTWLASNIVRLQTEDVRGKVITRYYTTSGLDLSPENSESSRTTEGFAGEIYTTTKSEVMNKNGKTYIYKELDSTSATPTGSYEKQVTKKVTYLYEEASEITETKNLKRTINYLEKYNDTNVLSQPVEQIVTVSRKVYLGKESGRRIESEWTIENGSKWSEVTSPILSGWENPEVRDNDQYIAKDKISEVIITSEVVNNGDVIENVYYERFVSIGGDVIARYVIEDTTTELKPATDIVKGLKVGKDYISTAPAVGEELTAKDGKVYVYKGHKATSAPETGKVTEAKQEVVYEYAPKVGGNVEVKYVIAGTDTNLKDPVTLVTNGQVGSDYTATKENTLTKDGLVYELVKTNNGLKEGSAPETGKVTEAKQEVVYEYAPKVGGNVEVKYVIAGTDTNLKDPVTLVTNGQVGSDYTATKENTLTKDGLVYELVKTNNGLKEGSAPETGKVTEAKQEVVYEYAPKVGGNVEVKYVIAGTDTNLKDPVTLVTNGQVGSDYTATKENTLTKDGLVYELVKTNNGLKEGSAPETGKVTEAKQEVVYEYAPKVGGNVEVKYVIAGTDTNLKDPVTLVTNGQVGSDYTATKENTLTKDGLVYELVKTNNGLKEGSAPETGKVTEAKQEVVYEYAPKVGGNVEVKYVIAGTDTNLKDPVTLVTNGQVGSDYTATKENTLTKDGLVYELVKTNNGLKEGSAPETGKVTEAKQEVVYEYAPKVGGNVEVKYVIAGTDTNLKDPVTLVTNGQVGSDYTATKENTLTKDGLVYELVKTNNGLKEGSAPETGKVTEAKQEVVYEYAPKVGGNVEVKYVIAGTDTNLKDPVTLVTNGQVGSDYTATKENTLTKDGLVYELVKTNNGLKEGSAPETGKVTEAKQEVVYEYAPKVGGNVEVKYVIAGTDTNLKDPVTLVTNGQVGSDYTATKENTLTKDGLVYELVKTNNGLKEGSAPETGKVTEAKQEVVYEYAPKVGGNVEVKYVIAGTDTNLKDPVTLVTNGQVGSDYTATKENTLTKDGLVYELVKTNNGLKEGSAPETGKVTEAKQEVVYEYAPKVEPTPDKPVDPTPDKPVDPTPDKPVDPTPDKPVDPTPDKPVEPTPNKPVAPTSGKPVALTPPKGQLPNTGETTSVGSTVLGVVAGLLGLAALRRRKEGDER